ncbi:PadR family transcriptional regulator [Nocardioides seonyuensis]|uniref:PadR family transcriptional regulator n=1 Tax=Nocardioides seonyuensis TaxID=2518371 RepID=A0A4P7ICF6_9ACTN|nr:helix-turn-helix transcriptional regulator [Nocardioides seonyuensis]QBX54270.1 PadR family transcriptional regulator [Nocardioides seonyuensis]
MSQDLPQTTYAILGLLTFGDELTGYEVKQRADATLRFYWVAPAMSQVYKELARLTDLGLVEARTRADGGREVTTYALSPAGEQTLRAWMTETPAGFPVLKHTVLLRLLMSRASDPETVRRMLRAYLDELDAALDDLTGVRESLRSADEPGQAFYYPSVVADWGLDYFVAEARHTRKALERLAEHPDRSDEP